MVGVFDGDHGCVGGGVPGSFADELDGVGVAAGGGDEDRQDGRVVAAAAVLEWPFEGVAGVAWLEVADGDGALAFEEREPADAAEAGGGGGQAGGDESDREVFAVGFLEGGGQGVEAGGVAGLQFVDEQDDVAVGVGGGFAEPA